MKEGTRPAAKGSEASRSTVELTQNQIVAAVGFLVSCNIDPDARLVLSKDGRAVRLDLLDRKRRKIDSVKYNVRGIRV